VAALTKDMRLIEPQREKAYDAQLAKGPWEARLIKLADVYDNLCDMTSATSRRKQIGRAKRAIELAAGDKQLNRARKLVMELVQRLEASRQRVEALSSETERACGYMSLGPAIAALVDVARGDVERAEERLALVPMARTQAILGRAAAAEVMVQLGRAGEARDLARQLREEDDRMYWPLLSLLEALVALEEWPALGEALADVRARAAASVRFGPAADRAEGVRLLASGDRVEAERLLRAALEAYERIGMPFEAARTLEHLAEASEGDDATAFLRGALERYERLGAAPHAARVRGAGR